MGVWRALGFGGAIVVVLVVVVLGLLILGQARRIRALALTAAEVVAQIDANTRSVWALKETNATAEALVAGAGAIENNLKRIEDTAVGDRGQRTAA